MFMLKNSKIGGSDIRAKIISHPVKVFCLQVLEPSGQAVVKRHCDSISPTVLNIRDSRALAEALKSFARCCFIPTLPDSEILRKLNSYTSGEQLWFLQTFASDP
jgi:hypothetical protein